MPAVKSIDIPLVIGGAPLGLAQHAALVAALLVPIELAERPVGAGIAAATRLQQGVTTRGQ